MKRSRQLWTFAATLIVGVLLVACSGESEPVASDGGLDAASGSTTSALPSSTEPDRPIEDVYSDPADGSRLRARVTCAVIPDGPADIVEVVETQETVTMVVVADRVAAPCLNEFVPLQLDSPLGNRSVIDGSTGAQIPVEAVAPRDPDRTVPAECTSEAARRAVEMGVDGGLRSDLLTCDENWMAVATSSNACAPTGEAQDPDGCVGNQHTAYWRNRDGAWSLVTFGDCDSIRRQYEDFGDANCAT